VFALTGNDIYGLCVCENSGIGAAGRSVYAIRTGGVSARGRRPVTGNGLPNNKVLHPRCTVGERCSSCFFPLSSATNASAVSSFSELAIISLHWTFFSDLILPEEPKESTKNSIQVRERAYLCHRTSATRARSPTITEHLRLEPTTSQPDSGRTVSLSHRASPTGAYGSAVTEHVPSGERAPLSHRTSPTRTYRYAVTEHVPSGQKASLSHRASPAGFYRSAVIEHVQSRQRASPSHRTSHTRASLSHRASPTGAQSPAAKLT
jgi:hypothetical protein